VQREVILIAHWQHGYKFELWKVLNAPTTIERSADLPHDSANALQKHGEGYAEKAAL
tara:strand:+ start:678 stop:848 length:171 start_codon:yes stop_codon:yes gene_type:complete